MKILFVQPALKSLEFGFSLVAMPEPLALEVIAASLPDHEVRILDMRFDPNLKRVLEDFSPDLVGVTALTTEVYSAQEVMVKTKEVSSDIFTLVGGHHATLLPEDFNIPQADAIAPGEGELILPDLIDAISNGRKLDEVQGLIWQDRDGHFIRNSFSTTKLNMNDMRLPRRDLTSAYRDEYFFITHKPDSSMASSRGCPYQCRFCSVWEFYDGSTKQMSPERVIEEIKAIETPTVSFLDDNFMLNNKRENAIADLIRSEGIEKQYFTQCRTDSIVRHPELLEKWSEIGLQGIFFGLEGASNRTLKKLNKSNVSRNNDEAIRICRDNGVIVWGAFIVDPDWSEDDFKQLHDYVEEKEITFRQFSVLTPLPGTQLYRSKVDELLTNNYIFFDCLHSVLPTRLPREQFYEYLASLYQARTIDFTMFSETLRRGDLTMANIRRAKVVQDIMSNPEFYIQSDPILGGPI